MWVSVVLFLWCVWGFTEVLMQLKELSVSEGLPVWFCPPVPTCGGMPVGVVRVSVLFISLFISL